MKEIRQFLCTECGVIKVCSEEEFLFSHICLSDEIDFVLRDLYMEPRLAFSCDGGN